MLFNTYRDYFTSCVWHVNVISAWDVTTYVIVKNVISFQHLIYYKKYLAFHLLTVVSSKLWCYNCHHHDHQICARFLADNNVCWTVLITEISWKCEKNFICFEFHNNCVWCAVRLTAVACSCFKNFFFKVQWMMIDYKCLVSDFRCTVSLGPKQEHRRCYNVSEANTRSVWLEH